MTFLKKKNLTFIAVAATLVMAAFTFSAKAQPQNPPPPQDTPVPITGIEYLIISGGILGGYKLLRNKGKVE